MFSNSDKISERSSYMKSQYINTFVCFLFYVGVGLLLLSTILPVDSPYRIGFLLFFVCSSLLYIWYSRCPHCGKTGLRLRLFGKDCGYCTNCGELIEFKE